MHIHTTPRAQSKWTLLDDNDPTGFRPKAGMKAKEAAGLKAFEIPRRCAQFKMFDYPLWEEVEKRMRAQAVLAFIS